MSISIIIPTLNEAKSIGHLVTYLLQHAQHKVVDVMVIDGGSTDHTVLLAEKAGATVYHSPKQGRAAHMNYGVTQAKGTILYFVHADTLPPTSYATDLEQAIQENYPIGCYRFQFDSDKWMLKINAYFTRFDALTCRGGDQTLFITKTLFEALNGYQNEYVIMEEYDLIVRARKQYPFKIIPKNVLVSARKYEQNSWLRVQLANFIVFNLFRLGYSQELIKKTYQWWLK